MTQVGFAYAGDSADDSVQEKSSCSVAIFADHPYTRAELLEDVADAGWRVNHAADVATLLDSRAIALGEAVLLDCSRADGAVLAALARLDMRIARSGAQLVVITQLDALDAIFGCFDQSAPQILVAPSRAERILALGRVLGRNAGGALREFSHEDRLAMLRLVEQVEQLARQIGGITSPDQPVFAQLSEKTGGSAFSLKEDPAEHKVMRAARPALPDPRLIRRILRQRQLRGRFFDAALFADPAWDMLLDLTASRAEHARVSVSSLCIASGVPPTTALRWITQLTEAGLLVRQEDEADRRRAFIALSDEAVDAMARYFAELDRSAASLV